MEIYDADRFHLITIRVTISSSVYTNMEAVRGIYFLNKHMAGLVVSSVIFVCPDFFHAPMWQACKAYYHILIKTFHDNRVIPGRSTSSLLVDKNIAFAFKDLVSVFQYHMVLYI